MQIQEKKIDVVKITLNLEEAHQLAMVLDDYIGWVEKGKKQRKKNEKVPPVVTALFEYFDGRLL